MGHGDVIVSPSAIMMQKWGLNRDNDAIMK